jgi:hypothetical protein
VVVQDAGLRTDLEFHPGNIGPANLDIGFKPPSGAGVRIDSPFVTGGGFLFFDSDKGQYGGVLQLDVKGITVTAIGLIATRLPNGARGFPSSSSSRRKASIQFSWAWVSRLPKSAACWRSIGPAIRIFCAKD